jgi:transcriptional regulator with XRE-family HTH domain
MFAGFQPIDRGWRMRINAELVRKLRGERHWSQEQLAAACGVNLRTIQRLENTGKGSMESVRALASVFEVDADELFVLGVNAVSTPPEAIRKGFLNGVDFSGAASRFEYWWFLLFVLMAAALATLIGEKILQLVSLIVLLPLLSVGTRRLRDAGRSGWWQLLFLVPFGQVVVLYLLALPSHDAGAADANHAEAA